MAPAGRKDEHILFTESRESATSPTRPHGKFSIRSPVENLLEECGGLICVRVNKVHDEWQAFRPRRESFRFARVYEGLDPRHPVRGASHLHRIRLRIGS